MPWLKAHQSNFWTKNSLGHVLTVSCLILTSNGVPGFDFELHALLWSVPE